MSQARVFQSKLGWPDQKVGQCLHCPGSRVLINATTFVCRLSGECEIPNVREIPEWCPLPKAEPGAESGGVG